MDKFWAKIDKTNPNGCWIWTGCRTSAGYGQIRMQGKALYAHRVMWKLTHGKIPEGLEILHHCDNPPCVNPEHLFLGTQSDNLFDSVNKGRFNRPCGENHSRAILAASQVLEIRKARISQRKLAAEYGVSRWAICGILSGKNWRCLL